MKHFISGVFLGLVSGLGASLVHDKQGHRLGQPLKDNFNGWRDDSKKLGQALRKAKQASRNLQHELPLAQRAISDLKDQVQSFQKHLKPDLEQLRQQSDQISLQLHQHQPKN